MVNSLRPSDAIWRHRSGSTLAQVMACCLTAPSHYLNQCWLIVSEVQWQSPGSNFTRDISVMNHKNYIENYLSKLSLKSPRGQWVNHLHGTETERLPMWLPYNKSQLLTYWGLYKMVDILQTTFLNAFCWWGTTVFLVKFHKNVFQNPTSLYSKFHWCLFLGIQQICQHWFTKAMAWLWMDELLTEPTRTSAFWGTSAALRLPILVIHIKSHVKRRQSQSYKLKKKLPKSKILKFCIKLHTQHTF